MLSYLKPTLGHVPANLPGQAGRVVPVDGAHFARTASKLWMALDNPEWVPDFNPQNMRRAPSAHPDLHQRIADLKLLPVWNSPAHGHQDSELFGKIITQQQFGRLLGEARVLAEELHSVWGDSDSLSLLELVGPELVVDAYDRADDFALSACAVAYTVIEADRVVRARLGAIVADEMSAVDVFSPIQFTRYSGLAEVHNELDSMTPEALQKAFPTTLVYSAENLCELHVQLGHPNLRPISLLTEVTGLYKNKQSLSSFRVEDFAVLLKEPVATHHLAPYFTLMLGPVQRLYSSIDRTIPDPVLTSVNWKKCKYAFEQCCRYFGEDFMMQNVFGQAPSTTHKTLFNERLMKIMPVLNRFLRGDETSWS